MSSNPTPQPTTVDKGKAKAPISPPPGSLASNQTGPDSTHQHLMNSNDDREQENTETRTMPQDDMNGETSSAANEDFQYEEMLHELLGYGYMLEYLEVRLKEVREERERLEQEQEQLQED